MLLIYQHIVTHTHIHTRCNINISLIYNIVPIPIFYSFWIMDRAAISLGLFIVVSKDLKHDKTTIQHELVHCKQFYRTLGLHMILYSISDKYRLNSEIEAYRKTIEVAGYTEQSQSEWIVKSIYKDYELSITKAEIRELLYRKLI